MPNEGVVQEPRLIDAGSNSQYINRIMIATPVTGLLRVEWVMGRFGCITPVNWSAVSANYWLRPYMVMRLQVSEAQNIACKDFLSGEFEWLLFWEHDVIPPPDIFVRIDEYMRRAEVPVVSGLYYTRSLPPAPLVFRGRGTGYYDDWRFGDLVWCDGVPTGMLLIHRSIIQAMWDESESYMIQRGTVAVETRRVFVEPRKMWIDPQTGQHNSVQGTSDLAWCSRIINDGMFAKAGWPEFAEKCWPFLVDTNLFCRHIENTNGMVFPPEDYVQAKQEADARWREANEPPAPTLGVQTSDRVSLVDKLR